MSDNTTLNAGFGGDVIATDDVGGVKYQRVKPAFGTDGTAVDVSSANPLPVTLGVPVLPVSDATIADLQAAIQTLNDTMLYMVTAMLDKMPRLDRNDRVNAMVSDASGNELNSPYYGISSNMVGEGTGGRAHSRIFEPWNFADAGSARIYENIVVA